MQSLWRWSVCLRFTVVWRFLKLDVDTYDYEYLREWRVPGKEFDFSGFPREHIIYGRD